MACCFDHRSTEDGYWLLRQKVAVLNTGELPLQFKGADALLLMDKLFTKDITKLKTGRCAYGLACYEDGGLIVDGILLRVADDCFWYAQADGDFYSWARAHAVGLNVEITDPKIFVSQVQGPNSMKVLASACDDGMPEPFGYFAMARVKFGGQEVVITRTGYTNELGWEYYTEAHHDAQALWQHLKQAGEPFGLDIFGLDAMHIRRIEAGILNAGSDFDHTTTPFDVGLGMFVDQDKGDFIGKAALKEASKSTRLIGILCNAEPHIGGEIRMDGHVVGKVTAGALSPYLKQGVGIALMLESGNLPDTLVAIGCIDGNFHEGKLATLPLYDKVGEIQRGIDVAIPLRD
jgi:aminomethyltransferase